jgi:hypothetical protein
VSLDMLDVSDSKLWFWGNDLTVTGDDSMLALTEAGAGLSVAFITRY